MTREDATLLMSVLEQWEQYLEEELMDDGIDDVEEGFMRGYTSYREVMDRRRPGLT